MNGKVVARVGGVTYSGYEVHEGGIVTSVKTGKELKPFSDGKGYVLLDLMKDNKSSRTKVHILVWESFNGKRDKNKIINHKDGDKLNNAKSNLEEVTQQENVAHAQVLIRGKEYLSPDKITRIKNKLKLQTIAEVAKEEGVKAHVIRDLKSGKTYK